MKSFLQTAYTAFSACVVFRVNTVLGILERLIRILVPLFVWSALYSTSKEAVINNRTLGEMVLYVLLSQTCMALISTEFASSIEARMRTGVIEYSFIRPISPRMIFIGEGLGKSLYAMFLTGFPAAILTTALIPLMEFSISWEYCLLFVVSLTLGYVVSVLFELLKGMFAFWFMDIYILNWFMDFFYLILSGSYVPLWFYPDWLRVIAKVLPFQAAYYLPVEIFLGLRDYSGCLMAFGIQMTWIVILWFLQELIWRKSVYKLVVLGG